MTRSQDRPDWLARSSGRPPSTTGGRRMTRHIDRPSAQSGRRRRAVRKEPVQSARTPRAAVLSRVPRFWSSGLFSGSQTMSMPRDALRLNGSARGHRFFSCGRGVRSLYGREHCVATEAMITYEILRHHGVYWLVANYANGSRTLVERFQLENTAIERLDSLQRQVDKAATAVWTNVGSGLGIAARGEAR